MAFAGLHVVASNLVPGSPVVPGIFNGVQWSEGPSTGVTSTNAAAWDKSKGAPVFHVYAAADSWVAIGPNPDETAHPKILVKGLTPTAIVVAKGDKFAWVAA